MIPQRRRSVGLKQDKSDDECIPCVAAMAVAPFCDKQSDRETVKDFNTRCRAATVGLKKKRAEFMSFFQPLPGGGWTDTDMMLWLLLHGFCMGIGYNKASQITLEAAKESIHIGAAYVVVESQTRGGGVRHALYWDGLKMWDPNPHAEDHMAHTGYQIIAWHPIYPVQVNATIVKKRGDTSVEDQSDPAGDDKKSEADSQAAGK